MRQRSISYEDLKRLEGQIFGRLTVISYDHSECATKSSGGGYDDYYKCQCSCENKTIILAKRHDLLRGHITSCGCLHSENGRKQLIKAITTHGLINKDRKFYNIWKGMKQRCSNQNNPNYENYGGRGIGIDWSWFMYENFFNDMHESYIEHCREYGKRDTSIERNDVNDMYCKENCSWATRKEQSSNQRRTIRIQYNNKEYTLRGLLDNFPHDESVTIGLLYRRIVCAHWDIERALTTPHIEYNN